MRRLGRGALWLVLALVFVRGMGEIVGGSEAAAPPPPTRTATPDSADEGRAFAVAFTRAYLTVNVRHRSEKRAVAPFVAPELRAQVAVDAPRRGPAVRVEQATVARRSALGAGRELFTVAASMSDGRTVYLAVPVAHTADGGLVVCDLPALVAPPVRAAVAAEPLEPLSDDADRVTDLIDRFLRAYVGGADAATLAYFVAPGTSLAPMPAGLRLVAVDNVATDGSSGSSATTDPNPHRRIVLATVRVREAETRATYRMRYRVTIVERDRWYVAAVIGGPQR